MAKVKGPFFGLEAHGTVGKKLQIRRTKARIIAARYGSHIDADTYTQGDVREHFQPVITAWHDETDEEKAAWDYFAPRNDRAWVGYSYFCHINLPRAFGGLALLRVPPDMVSCFEDDGAGDLEPKETLAEGRVGLFDVAGDGSLSPAAGTWYDLYFLLDTVDGIMPRV